MCYLTKNNNEGDGKCNLIPLIQLRLSLPVTGKQEAIRVQRWHRFQTRGEKEISVSWLSGTHLDSSLPHFASPFFSLPPLITDIVSLRQLFVIIPQTIAVRKSAVIQLETQSFKINFLAPVCCISLQTCICTP